MPGVSTYGLLDKPLHEALENLSAITSRIKVMDEGPHLVQDASLFENYSGDYVLHAPYPGMNIAYLFKSIRDARVTVMTDCFPVAAEIGAGVVMHPGYSAGEQERELADRQFKKSLQELCDAGRELPINFLLSSNWPYCVGRKNSREKMFSPDYASSPEHCQIKEDEWSEELTLFPADRTNNPGKTFCRGIYQGIQSSR